MTSEGKWTPAPHLDLIADWLVDLATGRRRRAVFETPPRHGKSELCSFWFLVWYLVLFPRRRVILASYEADFAATWGRRVRNTLTEIGPRYGVRIAEDSSAANRWDTTAGGGMFTTGIGGPMTGKGADLLVIDDPIKNAEEAASPTIQRRNWEWWQAVARTRIEPGGSALVIQTRWNENDLAGRLLAESKAGGEEWDELRLPAVAEDNDPMLRPAGAALWPARYDEAELAKIKTAVGSRVWSALYQQRPAPDEGGMFRREWLRNFYRAAPTTFDAIVESWDCTFKDAAGSDYVVGQVWGASGASRYLLDQVRARMDFPATLTAVRTLSAKWPAATAKLVEDKANGPAVIASLKREVPGLIPVEPQGGKIVRASAVTPLYEAGNVFLPDPSIAPWIGDYIEELATFPNGANDDQVDASTQALNYLATAAATPRIRVVG